MSSVGEHTKMLSAWREASARGAETAFATVVRISGSSYRRVGASMLIVEGGQRIGSVSGGCLEADIARKCFWWIADSDFAIKRYDTGSPEDGVSLGCGGVIDILIERLDGEATRNPILLAKECRSRRQAAIVSTSVANKHLTRAVEWKSLSDQTLSEGNLFIEGSTEFEFIQIMLPPIHLLICGSGADVQPLVRIAANLGWRVTVIDQRSDLATQAHFPEADEVFATPRPEHLARCILDERTAVVIMSHSYTQDLFFLEQMATRNVSYIGLMGARVRTQSLLDRAIAVPPPNVLRYPVGLHISAETPEEIALSIAAEVTQCFAQSRDRHPRLSLSSAAD